MTETPQEPSMPFTSVRLERWRSRSSELRPDFVKTLDKLSEFGWQRWSIASADPDSIDFAYTVGLNDMFGLPELITVGLPIQTGGAALVAAFQRMQEGHDLTDGPIKDILGNDIDVQFQEVDPRWLHRVMLRTHWYYEGEDVPVLQLIFPDLENRFQWEEGFEERFQQPMLAPGYPPQDLEQEFWDSHDLDFDKKAWKFEDPPERKVMTSQAVVQGNEPVTYVARYEDGAWIFLGPTELASSAATARLRRLVAADKSLEGVAELPAGWSATRSSTSSAWERFEDRDEDDAAS